MFARSKRQHRLLSMELVGAGNVDHLDSGVGAQGFKTRITRNANIALKLFASSCPRVGGGDELNTLVCQKSGQHQREGSTESRHPNAQDARHKSSTNEGPLARDTQTMIWLSYSSSISTKSR